MHDASNGFRSQGKDRLHTAVAVHFVKLTRSSGPVLHGDGLFIEGGKAFPDGIEVIIDSTTGFAPLGQSSQEGVLGTVEKDHRSRFANLANKIGSNQSKLPVSRILSLGKHRGGNHR